MAAYPSFPQLVASDEQWLDDVVLDRAANGDVKARAFFGAKKRAFVVKHHLNAAQRTEMQQFYNANRLLAVSFTWNGDGQTYTCLFDGPPKLEWFDKNWCGYEVRLVQQ